MPQEHRCIRLVNLSWTTIGCLGRQMATASRLLPSGSKPTAGGREQDTFRGQAILGRVKTTSTQTWPTTTTVVIHLKTQVTGGPNTTRHLLVITTAVKGHRDRIIRTDMVFTIWQATWASGAGIGSLQVGTQITTKRAMTILRDQTWGRDIIVIGAVLFSIQALMI